MSQLTSSNPASETTAKATVRASAASASPPSLLSDFIELTKARLSTLVVITALLGFSMGWAGMVEPNHALTHLGITATMPMWALLLLTLISVALACMGAGALNEVMEAQRDAKMHRTADRPIPAGRMTPTLGLTLGLGLSASGVLLLALAGLWLASLLTLFTVISYVAIYTPLKTVHPISTLVGAIPGAMPPLIGYAAATGSLELPAVLLFLVMFAWQMPHFLAIAWLYRDDYARGGFAMLPVIDPTGASTFRQALLWCIALLVIGMLPSLLGVSGWFALLGSLIVGGMFLWFAWRLYCSRERRDARALFLASLVYLPVAMVLIVLDQA